MKLFRLLCMLLLAACVWSCSRESVERVLVYDMDYAGSRYYRIPALLVAPDGSLLAFADRRGDDLRDLPNTISVVCRRSEDGGRTWSDLITVAAGDSTKGITYGDPAVVADRNTGRIICVFAGDRGLWDSDEDNRIGVYVSESKDNGLTWSSPRSITDQIYRSGWQGLFVASGNGTQLDNGRLMFAFAARTDTVPYGAMHNYACYSDDGGQTWQVSANAADTYGDEAKVIQLADGRVMMSVRNREKGFRKLSFSEDGGRTWDGAYLKPSLPDPACNGDVIRYPLTGDGSRSVLLHSIPDSQTVRENVSLYFSTDEGANWKRGLRLWDGYSAYSSLAVLPDGSLGVLLEAGKWDGSIEGEDGFRLYFVRIPKKDIEKMLAE